MILAGFDIATNTGLTIDDGKIIRARSWRAKAKRPFGLKATEIDEGYEAEIAEEFRDFVLSTLIAEHVTDVGYEKPRTRDFERTKVEIDTSSEWAGQAFKKTTERSSSNLAMVRGIVLCAVLLGVCRRLNIPAMPIPADDWRKSILGYSRAPKGVKDGRTHLKKAVMEQCRRLGVQVANDDAADSVGVVFHLRALLAPYGKKVGDLFEKDGAGV
jgi:hypothetical protein